MEDNNGSGWNSQGSGSWNSYNTGQTSGGWNAHTPPPFKRQPIFINGVLNRRIVKTEANTIFKMHYWTMVAIAILPSLLAAGMSVIPFVGGIASIILTPVFWTGSKYVYVWVVRNRNYRTGNMFDIFSNFGNICVANLTTNILLILLQYVVLIPVLFILLAVIGPVSYMPIDSLYIPVPTQEFIALLSVAIAISYVPRIYMSFCWAMVPYLLADNQQMRGAAARKLSHDMMVGHKWELFKLYLSFIGWGLLSLITIGIVYIFKVGPWLLTVSADYYDNLRMLYAAQHRQQTNTSSGMNGF